MTTSLRPADFRNGKTHWTVVQISIFKKMKHDAMDDDEKDNSKHGNATCMKNHEFDGAICDNVLQILYMILPKPRFRYSADQFALVGTMESASLKARKKVS